VNIIWSKRAADNLDYFKYQIRAKSGLDDVAEKFYEKVVNRVSRLSVRSGWIGMPVKEYPGAGYKSIIIMDYRIIYKILGNEIHIVTFIHKRMLIKDRI
jgi:mRNA-degrading endonuclease RelE of RelBE toxin-antitoxin system